MILITQLIYVNPGKEPVFNEFEDRAIPLMKEYSGRLIQRVRPRSEDFVAGEDIKPYEIHVVSFESEERFQAFLKDDRRLQIKHLKDDAVKSILMFKGEPM